MTNSTIVPSKTFPPTSLVEIDVAWEDHAAIIHKAAGLCRKIMNLGEATIAIASSLIDFDGYALDLRDQPLGYDFFLMIKENNWEPHELVKLIAHECCHIKQYLHDGLVIMEGGASFKGKDYRDSNDAEYWFSPWEIEARGFEEAIWLKYTGEI